jgi:4-azaleucine resistance transporter AzlC
VTSGPLPQRDAILRAAIGIGIYAAAFGAAYGAVSVAYGLSLAQTMVLSLVMFSGASQFAFVGIAASAGSPFAAVGPALLLGVRNALYGVPVSEILHPGGWLRLLAAQLVVDETTAMATGQTTVRAKRYAFWTTGLVLFALWQLGSLAGAVLGRAIDPAAFGLDAAAPAVFLALLWPRLRSRGAAWVAICGAAVAVLLVPVAPLGVPVIAAAAVAVIAGLLPDQRAGHANKTAES